jgi:cellobiose-specific phosphotransferase system component IIA
MKTAKEIEIDRNYEVFQAALPEILKTHYAQTALLRQQNLVGFIPTLETLFMQGKACSETTCFQFKKSSHKHQSI